jgi:hypothetical protein
MNREELMGQIKPYVEKYIDGFYDEKFEGANIRQILTIAEKYAESKVSELKAENEKLKDWWSLICDWSDKYYCGDYIAKDKAIEELFKKVKQLTDHKATNE